MVKRLITKPNFFVDLIIRWGSAWVGVHYSSRFESYCIAPLPCIVLRVGRTEYKQDCKAG
jgi:hypothetical protein